MFFLKHGVEDLVTSKLQDCFFSSSFWFFIWLLPTRRCYCQLLHL